MEYLRELLPAGTELKVVVAYDVRQYSDLRGMYPPEVPNPLLGFTSKDFAHIAASVYCAAGVKVYLLPDELDDYISTPELSFLIRRYGAHGGLNVSASHNHPDDNGGKFYNMRGGQEVPPYDEQMVKIVERITDVNGMAYDDALVSGLIYPITPGDRHAYIDLNLGLRLRKGPGVAKIVYSPLHGTGRNTVGRCLQAMGFEMDKQYFEVPEQRAQRAQPRRIEVAAAGERRQGHVEPTYFVGPEAAFRQRHHVRLVRLAVEAAQQLHQLVLGAALPQLADDVRDPRPSGRHRSVPRSRRPSRRAGPSAAAPGP